MRRCVTTAPPFCAMPVMSMTLAALPSRWAAMPRIDPTVSTPVPPMPVMSTLYASGSGGLAGGDKFSKIDASSAGVFAPSPLRGPPPSTETNEGQNPSRQLKSLLQFDWSILRLRPNSVSSGWTLTQLDFLLQSPQPSHTS